MQFSSGRGRFAIVAALSAVTAAAALGTTFKQPGFSESVVFSGLTNPTQIRFLPDGRILVAEKSGVIKLFDGFADATPDIVVDLRTQVHNFWDRGLLGIAVDPDFATNNAIYALYAHDAFIGGTAPLWGSPGATSDGCPSPPGPTTDGCVVSGRLSRLTAVGPDWSASEEVLIEDWCQQFPSHSTGSMAFGADGYLYLTGGDGASFNNQDWGQFGGGAGSPTPKNPCGDPPVPVGGQQVPPSAEGGALRSQSPRRTAGEPRVLNGTLLRVEKATGDAAPGNPFSASSDANERRIVAHGLRNPFRMIVKPGTNDVWIADVGWSSWEELNRVPDPAVAHNFGWPCFEGPGTPYGNHNICPGSGLVTAPVFQYNHGAVAVPGDGCPTGSSSIAGMAFYGGGSNYPPAYGGALFFSDYSRRCLWVMFPGSGGDPDPAAAAPFASNAFGPVDLQIGPDGNLYYVDFNGGRVLRISYGLRAVASANPTSGLVPLDVQFDSAGTQPAQPGDTLAYAWDLDGDGQFDDSTQTQPTFTYLTNGVFSARLRVTDNHGGFHVSDPVIIQPGNQAPTATILTPSSSLTWKVGDPIGFSGEGMDPQDGALAETRLSWSVVIHHCPSNCHTHVYQTFPGAAAGSFAAPDHEYPAYLEIQLTATDSGGLTGTSSVILEPQTVVLTLASSPAGLQLSAGTTTAAAPFTRPFIVGSQTALVAPSPQGAFPSVWEFGSWSDGGASSHTVTVPAAPATYSASFATRADLSLAMAATPDPVCEGQPITYTLDVANAGPSQALSVSVGHALPPGSTLVGAGGTGWSCNGGGGVVTCTMPSLGITAAAPITVVVAAPAGVASASSSATVGSVTTDISGGDNSANASTQVLVSPAEPTIAAPDGASVGATGLAASAADYPGSAYAWTLSGGSITGGQGSHAITFDAGPPGTTMILRLVESSSTCPSPAASWRVQVDFLDVPPAHPFHDFISGVARAGIAAGCGAGNYCPQSPNTRAQMAAFLLKAKLGESHAPPPASGTVFSDPGGRVSGRTGDGGRRAGQRGLAEDEGPRGSLGGNGGGRAGRGQLQARLQRDGPDGNHGHGGRIRDHDHHVPPRRRGPRRDPLLCHGEPAAAARAVRGRSGDSGLRVRRRDQYFGPRGRGHAEPPRHVPGRRSLPADLDREERRKAPVDEVRLHAQEVTQSRGSGLDSSAFAKSGVRSRFIGFWEPKHKVRSFET